MRIGAKVKEQGMLCMPRQSGNAMSRCQRSVKIVTPSVTYARSPDHRATIFRITVETTVPLISGSPCH